MPNPYVALSKQKPDITLGIQQNGDVVSAQNLKFYGLTIDEVRYKVYQLIQYGTNFSDEQKKLLYHQGVKKFFDGKIPKWINDNDNQIQCCGKNGKTINFDILGFSISETSRKVLNIILRMNNQECDIEDGKIRSDKKGTNIIIDSDQKHKEKELTDLKIRLFRSQNMEAIGTLAGGIAHDFNNILGSIMGYIELTLLGNLSETHKEDLTNALDSTYRARDLVKQILLFSNQEEGKKQKVSVGLIIDEVIKLLGPTTPATINIKRNIEKQIGLIEADPTHIHRIIVNLCFNANYAMSENGGTLKIGLKESTIDESHLKKNEMKHGKYIKFTVGDTGTGIPDDIKEKIFNPFFTTKPKGKGNGMGLSVVHGIVKNNGGYIFVDSELGKGTNITIYFPMTEEITKQTLSEKLNIPTGNEHILIVDDEEKIQNLFKAILERLGYSVTTSSNGIEALEKFEINPDDFDLVVTDFTMPGLTGPDLRKKIAEIKPEIPVIIMTGYNDSMSEAIALEKGFSKFLNKPVPMKELASAIRDTIDISKIL